MAAEPASVVFEGGDELMEIPADALSGIALTDRGHGLADVQFVLGPKQALRFKELTGRLVSDTLRVSVCGTVLAEPNVMVPIEGGHVSVTGEADYISQVFDALTTAGRCPDIGS